MSNLNKEPNESSLAQSREQNRSDRLLLFEQFGAVAYGVILQIIPNEKHAQEVLIRLFSDSILDKCKKCAASKIACVVKCSRLAALEFKKLSNFNSNAEENRENTNLSHIIFNLSFRDGYSLDAIAAKFSISKQATLKYIQDYFKTFRK